LISGNEEEIKKSGQILDTAIWQKESNSLYKEIKNESKLINEQTTELYGELIEKETRL
jgi:hypothetical protein